MGHENTAKPDIDDVCTQVHHLSPIEISKAPTLLDLWPEISGFIKNDPLVAHNAQFDMNFLNSECEKCSLPPVKNKVADTGSVLESTSLGADYFIQVLNDMESVNDDTVNAKDEVK